MATPPLKFELQDVEFEIPHEFAKQQPAGLLVPNFEDLEESANIELPLESSEAGLPPTAKPLVPSSSEYSLIDSIIEHNLKYMNLVCNLRILPFEVDVQNRRIYPTKSSLRWYWFYFISFTCLLKVLYIDGSLVAILLNPTWMQVLHLPTHFTYAIFASTTVFYIFLRPKSLRLSAVLVNAVLAKRDRVKSFSRQQFILAVMPIGITSIGLPITLGFPLLTTLAFQFGTLLRVATTEWTSESAITISPAAYGILRVAAYVMDAVPASWIAIGIVFMLMSQVLILEVLQSWCFELRSGTNRSNLADCYSELVIIQIIIGLFNQIFGDVVFLMKLLCFVSGISASVAVFWYGFSGHLAMGFANLYTSICCLMMYPLIYEKAALISGNMEEAKKSLLMATADLENDKDRAFWRRRVESIRVVCIKCGPRSIERESLPLFYDFFLSNFISVLLTT